MKLGMPIGLGPGHIVLHGDPAFPPPKKGRAPPQFSAHDYCGQVAAWIQMPLCVEADLSPGHIVLDGDPALPPKVAQQPPSFRPMFIVATVANLSYC